MMQTPPIPPGVDPETPAPARLYDYYLGGTINYEVDRKAADQVRKFIPELTDAAWANRGFHQRAAKWLAGEAGVRQFIDIGSGLPTVGNTHEVVDKVAPGSQVVYVDHDPIVLAHARELLTSAGNTRVILEDLREPGAVLGNRDLKRLIDFDEPVGLLMTWVLHFVADGSDPWSLVSRYLAALAPGSYLVVSHVTADKTPPRAVAAAQELYSRASEMLYFRTKAEITRFFDGLEIVPPYDGGQPAVVHVGEWGADDPEMADSDGSHWSYGAVGRRP
ncbi:MAG TPA: SAM-dependent methyltransferase [Streptosporangiaceae bacterium]|jgi:hypothetical protein|nr:SAM-dependent methyltransferase [Streptosporangiaceae bacterium]